VLLGKLEDELGVYPDLGELFSLGGRGYKRVVRAPNGVTSVRRYVDWREKQREKLAETASAELEGTEYETGFGRFADSDEAFIDCPLCGDEVFNTRVGSICFRRTGWRSSSWPSSERRSQSGPGGSSRRPQSCQSEWRFTHSSPTELRDDRRGEQ